MADKDWMGTPEVDGQACNPVQISPLPKNPVVAMAYVPFQQFNANNVYSADRGFEAGTIFPDLDKPFYGRRGEPR